MILERLFGASLNNPQFNLNDALASEILGGAPSDSGVRVNREVANTYSPWFRGINLVSRDVAKLPLYTYERTPAETEDGQEGKRRYREHPAYPVLRRKANRNHTAFHLKLALTAHAMSTGNGFGYIVRRADGSVLPVREGGGIIPMDPNTTVPVRETVTNDDIGEIVSSDRLWYVTSVQGEQRKIEADDVLHIRGMGFDGLSGYDVVKLATGTIGRGLAQQKFANKFFANGAHMSVVLETPGTVNPKTAKEIIESWNRMHQGLEASHRTAILQGGLKANQLASNARNAQLIESEEFVIRFVANFLGIPPHKLGAKTGESYASKEQENLDYLFQALDFWLGVWEDECWDKLLTEQEKDDESAFVEFSREKLFEADLKTKAEYWRVALGGVPWAKINEARSSFNMNPEPGGDEIKTPLNMGGAGAAADGEPSDDATNEAEGQEPGPNGAKPAAKGKTKTAAEQGNIQATALNGAQMTAMQGIVQATADKLLPPESAKAQLQVAFPLAEESKINAIIDPLKDFEQPKKEQSPQQSLPGAPPNAPPAPPKESAKEPADDSKARLATALHHQLSSTVARMVRRAGHAAESAAKDPKRFMAWLDAFDAEQGKVIREDVRAVEAACNAFAGRPESEQLAGWIITGLRDGLLEWTGSVKRDRLTAELPAVVARIGNGLEEKAAGGLLP